MKKHDYSNAILLFIKTLETNISQPDVKFATYVCLGFCYNAKKDYNNAKSALEKSILLKKDEPISYLLLAQILLVEGNNKKAKSLLTTSIKNNPYSIENRRLLAYIYLKENNIKEAERLFLEITGYFPNNINYHFSLYLIYTESKEFEKANEQLKIVISLAPNNLNYQKLLAENYIEQGKNKEAITIFENILKAKPKDKGSFFGLYKAYLKMGWLNNAKDSLNKTIELDPKDTQLQAELKNLQELENSTKSNIFKKGLTISIAIWLLVFLLFTFFATTHKKHLIDIITKFNKEIDQIYDIKGLSAFLVIFFTRLTQMKSGALFLFNRQNNTLKFTFHKGFDGTDIETIHICTGPGVSNWLMSKDKNIYNINELKKQKYFEEAFPSFIERIEKLGIQWLLLLKEKNILIGFIALKPLNNNNNSIQEPDVAGSLLNIASQSIEALFLYEFSITDEKVGLFNNRHFKLSLSVELKRADRYGQPCSLIIFDIDNFKKINDIYGHSTGDDVLREIAKLVIRDTREGIDIPARIGGEEFGIILPATNTERAIIVAERIRKSVEEHEFEGFDKKIKLTVSVGVATYPYHATDETQLFQKADQAEAMAKKSGKNRVYSSDEITEPKKLVPFDKNLELDSRFEGLNIKDENTGLYNFSYFSLRLQEELKRANRYNFPCSILALINTSPIDKDHLPSINKQIAILLKESMRTGIDCISFLDNNVFSIIIPESDSPACYTIAYRLTKIISSKQLFPINSYITVACSIASYPKDANSPNELFKKCAEVLDDAKINSIENQQNSIIAAI